VVQVNLVAKLSMLFEHPQTEVRAKAKANSEKRNEIGRMPTKEEFERPYVSKYNPNSRFMITVTKDADFPDHGVILTEYKTKWKCEIYVAEVEPHGPFYKTGMCGDRHDWISINPCTFAYNLTKYTGRTTALDRGDKILAINGRKHPNDFKTIQQATKILESRAKSTLFVMRPDPLKDEGYKWVMDNT
jgi:hypothetical protein